MEDLARCPGIGERKVYYQWWNCDGIMICPYLFVVFVAWSWSPAHSDVLAKKIWIFCTLPDNRSSACLTLFMNPSSVWNPAGKPFQRLLSRTSQLVQSHRSGTKLNLPPWLKTSMRMQKMWANVGRKNLKLLSNLPFLQLLPNILVELERGKALHRWRKKENQLFPKNQKLKHKVTMKFFTGSIIYP